MITVIAVAAIVGEAYKDYLKNQKKTLEIRASLLQEERLLEEQKQKTLLLENERLRLELDTDVAKYEREKETVLLEKR